MTGLPFIVVSIAFTLAGIFFGAHSVAHTEGSERKQAGQLEAAQANFVAPDIIVYPLQAGNTLGGYLVLRLVLQLASVEEEKSALPDETVLAEALYSSIFSMRSYGSESDTLPTLETLTSTLIKTANSNVGYPRYEGVLFQQFDYFEPNTIRRKNVLGRVNQSDFDLGKPKSTH